MTNPYRTGFATSEFWLSLIGVIVTYFVSQNVLTPAQAAQLTQIIGAVAVLIIMVYKGILAAIAIWKIIETYVQSRHDLKQTMLEANQVVTPETTTPVNQ